MYHPSAESVIIAGLKASNNGRSCEAHLCCDKEVVLDFDACKVQVWRRGKEEAELIWFQMVLTDAFMSNKVQIDKEVINAKGALNTFSFKMKYSILFSINLNTL